MMTGILLVVFVAFGKPTVHFFDTAALAVAVTVAIAAASVAAALVFAASMSARRRRAAAGGCVTCQFRCQHAMTEIPAPRWPAGSGAGPQALLPIQPVAARVVRDNGLDLDSVPRWPDQPVYRARQRAT
jgi:hypothetical protein